MGRVGSGRATALVAGIVVLGATVAGSPVGAQSPAPSAGAVGQAGVVTLGADRELFRDDFRPVRKWGLRDTDTARIEAEDGGLRFRLEGADHSDWSWHTVPETVPVLRAAVSVAIDDGRGEAGPMCGAAGDNDTFYTGSVTTTGDWLLGRIVDSSITWIAQQPLPGGLPDGQSIRVELECAVTGEEGDRLALFVDGVNVADVTDAESLGPFDKVGLVAGITKDRFRVMFDDLVVLGGDAYAPQVTAGGGPDASPSASPEGSPDASPGALPEGSPAASPTASGEPGPDVSPAASLGPLPSEAAPSPIPVGALLDAIPEPIRGGCRAFEPDAATGQLEAILCVPAGGVDAAEYYRYDTSDSLQAAFIRLIPADAGVTGTDCTTGPAMVEYTIGGRSAGTLACYDDPRGGVTVQWADDDLLVLAFGTTQSGTYADAYTWWQDAGPQP